MYVKKLSISGDQRGDWRSGCLHGGRRERHRQQCGRGRPQQFHRRHARNPGEGEEYFCMPEIHGWKITR